MRTAAHIIKMKRAEWVLSAPVPALTIVAYEGGNNG
jgi:hypothetical protein